MVRGRRDASDRNGGLASVKYPQRDVKADVGWMDTDPAPAHIYLDWRDYPPLSGLTMRVLITLATFKFANHLTFLFRSTVVTNDGMLNVILSEASDSHLLSACINGSNSRLKLSETFLARRYWQCEGGTMLSNVLTRMPKPLEFCSAWLGKGRHAQCQISWSWARRLTITGTTLTRTWNFPILDYAVNF